MKKEEEEEGMCAHSTSTNHIPSPISHRLQVPAAARCAECSCDDGPSPAVVSSAIYTVSIFSDQYACNTAAPTQTLPVTSGLCTPFDENHAIRITTLDQVNNIYAWAWYDDNECEYETTGGNMPGAMCLSMGWDNGPSIFIAPPITSPYTIQYNNYTVSCDLVNYFGAQTGSCFRASPSMVDDWESWILTVGSDDEWTIARYNTSSWVGADCETNMWIGNFTGTIGSECQAPMGQNPGIYVINSPTAAASHGNLYDSTASKKQPLSDKCSSCCRK